MQFDWENIDYILFIVKVSLKNWDMVSALCLLAARLTPSGPIFCFLLGVSSDYAQPITGQVTEVTCPVIGQAQPELTPSKRQKTGPGART